MTLHTPQRIARLRRLLDRDAVVISGLIVSLLFIVMWLSSFFVGGFVRWRASGDPNTPHFELRTGVKLNCCWLSIDNSYGYRIPAGLTALRIVYTQLSAEQRESLWNFRSHWFARLEKRCESRGAGCIIYESSEHLSGFTIGCPPLLFKFLCALPGILRLRRNTVA